MTTPKADLTPEQQDNLKAVEAWQRLEPYQFATCDGWADVRRNDSLYGKFDFRHNNYRPKPKPRVVWHWIEPNENFAAYRRQDDKPYFEPANCSGEGRWVRFVEAGKEGES